MSTTDTTSTGIEWKTYDPANLPGSSAPGIWVCEIDRYDMEDSRNSAHSVAIFPDRAQAVAWAMEVIDDERQSYDDSLSDDDDRNDPFPYLWEENHQQPLDCDDGRSITDHWCSTWLMRWPHPWVEGEWYTHIAMTVRQARFGFAYVNDCD